MNSEQQSPPGDSLPELKALRRQVAELKSQLNFSEARKLLAQEKEKLPDRLWIAQQLALCTYKDEELLPATRFATALDILESVGLRDPGNTNPETLALGGAIYKRMWEHGGQLELLYEALAFYRAAFERNPDTDLGYGGVNAAYILDLLAARARTVGRRSGTASEEARLLIAQAANLREQMAATLPEAAAKNPELEQQYWFVVTLAEIHFGLGNYQEVGRWLAKGRSLEPTEWEQQSTARQLVSLARLQEVEIPETGADPATWHLAWQALGELLGENTEQALTCHRGKVGLALSGGGFRASLFHLGVLARLAEVDALRSVEVLSTVSGGSIVGAHYYLEVRNLLQTKPDQELTREDYIDIVKRVQHDFVAGVARNIRTRAIANFAMNLKMAFSKRYSRSHRLGELYEQELYARVADKHSTTQRRLMKKLLIEPAGEKNPQTFKPHFSNWRRRAKAPVLLLNTTSLNSGHSWHFTASWMGEPPGLVGAEVDKNERYRRLYYDQAPTTELQDFHLGDAVAASSCVPGLFEPLVINDLYPDGRIVRLVDGGVHDNQGVQGLLNEGCTLILCSDAAGQMNDQKQPSDSLLQVPLRASSIMMSRVREAEYQDLRARLDSRALNGLFFIHLKQDLSVTPVDWINCQDPAPKPEVESTTTPYGINANLQRKIAAIRTDLDSFTEVESYALMLSGYMITAHQLERLQEKHKADGEQGSWGGYAIAAPPGAWDFLKLEPLMGQPEDSDDSRREDLALQLDVASSLFFKVWKLDPVLRRVSWVVLGILALLALWLIVTHWNTSLFESVTVGSIVLMVALIIVGALLPLVKWLSPEKVWRDFATKTAIAIGGFVVGNLHLLTFDKLFLKRGRLRRLLEKF